MPSEGFNGKAPEWPFPKGSTRERAVWKKAWTYPQAAQWIKEPWRWETIAMWVRRKVLAESPEATAADVTALHRLADQIGMTPAGLRENGWQIAADEVAAKRTAKPAPVEKAAPTRRLRSVSNGGR